MAAEVEAKAKPLLAKIEGRGEEAAGHTNAKVEHHAPAEATPRGPEPEDQVSHLVMNTLERGKIVGHQGQGTGRPVYEAIIDGESQPVAITAGSNGYVVGANPTRVR